MIFKNNKIKKKKKAECKIEVKKKIFKKNKKKR